VSNAEQPAEALDQSSRSENFILRQDVSAIAQDFSCEAVQMFPRKERSNAMMNLLQTLAAAAMLISVTVAANTSVLAGADSPYPTQFKNPNLPHVPVGAGSGIPAPYRVGD
jgi:hypothetical protein